MISKRSSVIQGTLTVDDLNRYLDEITENIGKQENQSKILQKIYNRATPDEQRWIIRIILKGEHMAVFLCLRTLTLIYEDMNISVKDTTVFGVFHPDAQDLYNTCSDLKKVAWCLWDPNKRLGDEVYCHNSCFSHTTDDPKGKRVHLFRAFAPMLCRRPIKLEESVREMQGKTFSSKKSLTENACNYTSVATSSSIARGVYTIIWVFPRYLIGAQQGKRLYVSLRSPRGYRELNTLYRLRV